MTIGILVTRPDIALVATDTLICSRVWGPGGESKLLDNGRHGFKLHALPLGYSHSAPDREWASSLAIALRRRPSLDVDGVRDELKRCHVAWNPMLRPARVAHVAAQKSFVLLRPPAPGDAPVALALNVVGDDLLKEPQAAILIPPAGVPYEDVGADRYAQFIRDVGNAGTFEAIIECVRAFAHWVYTLAVPHRSMSDELEFGFIMRDGTADRFSTLAPDQEGKPVVFPTQTDGT
jgi:hypothetical protein